MQNASVIQGFPVIFSTNTPKPATNATIEPTDRSIIPEMMIMAMPSVMRHLIEACSNKVERFVYEK
jgi:hypothetical protein